MNAREAFRAVWEKASVDRAHSKETSDAYWKWVKCFFVSTGRRSSDTWSAADWIRFEHLIARQNYSLSSRHQARNAMAFLFQYVLKRPVGRIPLADLPRPEKALKIIPTREELGRIFAGLVGFHRIKALMMYGSGPRINEMCHLRVHDVDLEHARLRIWNGKGGKHRYTVLPVFLLPGLGRMIEWRKAMHEWDLKNGHGYVQLPGRLALKYKNAPRELGWQFLFPSSAVRNGYRWYSPPDDFGRAMRKAIKDAGIIKRITPHTLRHAFASHLSLAGADIETIRQLLGHKDIETTLLYLHAGPKEAFSPLDVPATRLQSNYALERARLLSLP